MDNHGYRSLVIGKPGRMRDGLRCLLKAHPLMDKPLTANDIPSAILLLDEYQPDIILLDASLSSEDKKVYLDYVQKEYPLTKCIAINNRSQENASCMAAGAYQVQLDGFPADTLYLAINKALEN